MLTSAQRSRAVRHQPRRETRGARPERVAGVSLCDSHLPASV